MILEMSRNKYALLKLTFSVIITFALVINRVTSLDSAGIIIRLICLLLFMNKQALSLKHTFKNFNHKQIKN